MQSLPADTQRGVGQLVAEHGAGAREHLAYQAIGEWSPSEREALRTLAAASPEVRAQAARRRQPSVNGADVGEDAPASGSRATPRRVRQSRVRPSHAAHPSGRSQLAGARPAPAVAHGREPGRPAAPAPTRRAPEAASTVAAAEPAGAA